jgi:hypothetical protein
MEKGKIKLPWGDFFFTCATGLQPALLLGRPGLEGPTYDFFHPSRRGCGRRFYWGGRGWKTLPKGFECFVLKIPAVSTAALPH